MIFLNTNILSVILNCEPASILKNIFAEKYTEKLESLKDLQNVKDQIAVVKEVCKELKSNEGEITNILQKLVQIYITFPAKHQVKRVLISAFQSLPAQSSDFVVTELSRQLECIHTECLVSMDLRTYIDTVAGLMDNFPLGQKCIDNQCLEILQNVSSILSKFLAENSSTQSSVRQNELMHSCLACIQAGNKILQKSHSTLSCKESEEISSVTTSLIKHNIDILHIGNVTQNKTKVKIVLKFPRSSVIKVVEYIFQGTNKAGADKSDFQTLAKGDNLSCQLSLLYGIMSIMELSELVEVHDGKCLLLDYIFPSLTKISEKGYPNSISKLLTVKCYNMWTSKTCSCLKSEVVSDKQRSLLCGGGQIIEAIMSCVWTVWEDTTDVGTSTGIYKVIRIIAREIFENILKIHTMASSSDISTDIFLQNLTKKLIFHVSWSSKGKYGMLSNLVQIIGTDLVLQQTSDLSTMILSQMSEHALACHVSTFEY
ncbi:unnamed protein product [Mytilus edulis]|uniref:Uncharacterized protein n=1 Tax=Mytilus edulis TaxID=6550 RepID=A0A8S3S015_MYTED|nr:unnamed protein product [Mytilus edulis]